MHSKQLLRAEHNAEWANKHERERKRVWEWKVQVNKNLYNCHYFIWWTHDWLLTFQWHTTLARLSVCPSVCRDDRRVCPQSKQAHNSPFPRYWQRWVQSVNRQKVNSVNRIAFLSQPVSHPSASQSGVLGKTKLTEYHAPIVFHFDACVCFLLYETKKKIKCKQALILKKYHIYKLNKIFLL